jgi:hypothetical protein
MDEYIDSGTGQKMMKVAMLVKEAYIKTNSCVTDQDRQSLPVPVLNIAGPCVVFFYCKAVARPKQPAILFPPHYLVMLSATTGDLMEIRKITPEEFGQPSQAVGTFALPDGMTLDEYKKMLDRLYALYDILIPAFASGRDQADTGTEMLAKEFERTFSILGERPLLPYYRAVMNDFFSWIEKGTYNV